MLAQCVGGIVSGIVVKELEVANQRRPRKDRLEQIVTQQGFNRHTAAQGLLEDIDIV